MSDPEWVVVAKRLSANDTGATKSHQVGMYLTKPVGFAVAPDLGITVLNPKRTMVFTLESHDQRAKPDLTYYNNRFFGGTRDEFRITRFGGRGFALQDPESTGALLVLAVRPGTAQMTAWMGRDVDEEARLEAFTGPVLPGIVAWRRSGAGATQVFEEELTAVDACRPEPGDLPAEWLAVFPRGAEVAAEARRRAAVDGESPDRRLIRRIHCEYELFKVIERAHVEPKLPGLHDVDLFLALARSVLNRRMSRAGSSLEHQLGHVFVEEDVAFEPQYRTEPGSIVDFIFPSGSRYAALNGSKGSVHMLAAKTTLKDRWRQIVDEGAKFSTKHVFTLAEGTSEAQFADMSEKGLVLVVPRQNVVKFPVAVRPNLLDLDQFIDLVRPL